MAASDAAACAEATLVFMFGFAKNERDNIDDDELRLMKRIAATLLEMSEQAVRKALEAGELMEIKYGK